MTRIASTFERLKSEGSGAFIPYVCAGDPDASFTVDLVSSLCGAGADLVELGVPFSDPVADGPVIQGAMARSLSGGFKVSQTFELVTELRSRGLEQPLIIMSYYNPILKFGPAEFCAGLRSSGADGLLVVDLPIEESMEIDKSAAANGLDVIRLIAPTTDEKRLATVLSKGSGFVYVVSVAGTTGARRSLPNSTKELLGRVCSKTHLPVALGFGVSAPEHVSGAIRAGASGVIEGSKLVSLYAEHLGDRRNALANVERHVREMKSAARRARPK